MYNTVYGDGTRSKSNYNKLYDKESREMLSNKNLRKIGKRIPAFIIGSKEGLITDISDKIHDVRNERELVAKLYISKLENDKLERFKTVEKLVDDMSDSEINKLMEEYSSIIFPKEKENEGDYYNAGNIVIFSEFMEKIEEERKTSTKVLNYIQDNYKSTEKEIEANLLKEEFSLDQDIFIAQAREEIILCEQEEDKFSTYLQMTRDGGKVPYYFKKVQGLTQRKGKTKGITSSRKSQELLENQESSEFLILKKREFEKQKEKIKGSRGLNDDLKFQTYPPEEVEQKDRNHIENDNISIKEEKINNNIEK